MKFSTLICIISFFFLLIGCSKGSAEEVEIYTIGNDTEPTQVIKEGGVVKQIEELTNNFNDISIEEAILNGYQGDPDIIFELNEKRWFVYYEDQKTVIRKNAGTFFQASNEQSNELKSIFGKDVSGKE